MTDLPPKGTYHANRDHSSLLFRIKHLGLAWYTGRFRHLSATLDLDPQAIEQSVLTAEVDLNSVWMNYTENDKNWDKELAESKDFLDSTTTPTASFKSDRIVRRGESEADVVGQLSFRGHTNPLTFATIFNGAMLDHPSGKPFIGFSATGMMKRSDFGLTYRIGPRMPDEVQLIVETEMILENV